MCAARNLTTGTATPSPAQFQCGWSSSQTS